MWRSTDSGQTWTEGNISKTWGCVTAAHGGYVFAAESGNRTLDKLWTNVDTDYKFIAFIWADMEKHCFLRLCCCFLNFCSVVEKKEDTTVLYLKNVSQYDTNQGFCNCNMLSRSEQHYVIFRFSNKIGYCARREDVTEAVRLLDNYTSGIQNIPMQQNIQLNNNMVPPTRSGNETTYFRIH